MPRTKDTRCTPALDADGSIAANVPCIKCSYNLRTLQPAGNCPECGTPVASSVSGTVLRCLSPPTLTRLRAAIWLALGSFAATMIFALLLVALLILSVSPSYTCACIGRLLVDALLIACVLTLVSRPAVGPVSIPILARGALVVISLGMLLPTVAFCVPAPWLAERSMPLSAVHSLSAGVLIAAVSGYFARLIGVFGYRRLGVLGYVLAACFAASGLLGGLAALILIDGRSARHATVANRLSLSGMVLICLGTIGILVFLPLVLRIVARERKIARDWQPSGPQETHPPAEPAAPIPGP